MKKTRLVLVAVTVVAAVLMLAAPAMAANLITNGDFEAGNTGFTSEYEYVSVAATTGGESGLGTLDQEGAYAIGLDSALYHQLWESLWDHTKADGTGLMMIVNGNEDASPAPVLYQTTVTGLTVGRDYQFSFWGATIYPAAYAQLELWINDAYVDTYDAPAELAAWSKYEAEKWTADSDTAVIKLIDVNTVHTGNDFAIDDVSLEIVDYPSVITSFKWYDYNMDGNHWWWPNGTENPAAYDEGEGFIPGWKVVLLKDGVVIQTAYTGADGWYKFEPVPPGQYLVRECPGGPLWFRTNPVDVDYHVVNVLGDGHTFYCETKFYNVRKCCIGGYTMGYWSNKNGLRDLRAFAPGGVITPEPYGPMTITQIQAMAKQANAVDMCVMLKAQYVAHWLSVNVKGLDYSGYTIGEGLLYDDVMADFVADFPTLCDPANRAKAEFYKNFFDGLNNGKGWRICTYEEAMGLLPVW